MSSTEPPTEATWTIGRLLNWTTRFLHEKGVESPRLDAEVLLSHARGCQRIELYTSFDQEADESLRRAFRELVQRRAAGTPVPYLVGHREFFSLSFHVTPDVLIPRPESELLVVRSLDLAKSFSSADDAPASSDGLPGETVTLRVADVGTGSGVLAVCIAKQWPDSHVTAIDISSVALEIARKNAERHGVSERIDFVSSNLFEKTNASDFDIIVSNPPYVSSTEMAELAVDVRDHEPHLALDGGEQGTAIIEQLLPQASQRLRPGGWLLLEAGPNNAARVEQLLAETAGLELRETMVDLAGHPRVIQAEKKESHDG